MKLAQIEYFRAVSSLGSFSRAAAELGVAQPALSRQIRLLEEELGVSLLLRHAKGVEITEAGALLLERGEFLLRSVDEIKAEVRWQGTVPTGTLRFGCPPSHTKSIIIKPLVSFLKRYPGLSIHLQEGLSDSLRSDILEDRLDFAIMSTPLPHSNLTIQPLIDEEIWLFCPPGYLGDGDKVTLEQVSKLPVMVARRPHGVRSFVEQIMKESGLTLNIVVETDAWLAVPELVRQELGFFIAPQSAFLSNVQSGDISGGQIADLIISRSIVRRSDRPVRRSALEFTNLLTSYVPKRFSEMASARDIDAE